MKSLVFGIVLILLIGTAGFFYRNVAERGGVPEQVACTADAKMCPDGSSVGRTAPSCEFAACAFPNVEVSDAGVALVVPSGYENASEPARPLLVRLLKPSASESVSHTITVSQYPIPEGQTGDEVILAHTRYQPADMDAEDFSRFETTIINGKTYRSTVIERFEALVQSAYYLVRENDVFVFSVTEHDVTDWMNPELVVEELPEHQALLSLLSTLQTVP